MRTLGEGMKSSDLRVPIGTSAATGEAVYLDLMRLVETRGLLNANSGAGKSSIIRTICEAAAAHVQVIVFDPEGELRTLRDVIDVVIAGEDGDVAANPATAGKLARHLVEMNLSAVIDMIDLSPEREDPREPSEREQYMKDFINALMSMPRDQWRPILVFVDEAQEFVPEKGNVLVCKLPIIRMLTKGRKRQFCGFLSTLRISDLSKSAAAQCLNVFVGRTHMDVDQRRAGNMMGITPEAARTLRQLKPGEFYAQGPALGLDHFEIIRLNKPKSQPPKRGTHTRVPAPSSRIQKVIKDLEAAIATESTEPVDMEAALARIGALEKQLKSKADPEEVRRLKQQVQQLERAAKSTGDPVEVRALRGQLQVLQRGQEAVARKVAAAAADAVCKTYDAILELRRQEAETALTALKGAAARPARIDVRAIVAQAVQGVELPKVETVVAIDPARAANRPVHVTRITTDTQTATNGSFLKDSEVNNKQLILRWAARHHPDKVSKKKLALLCGMTVTGGTFKNYVGAMRSEGLVEYPTPGEVLCTAAGLAAAGDVGGMPRGESIVAMWRGQLGEGGIRKMFEALLDKGQTGFDSSDDLGALIHMNPTGGTYKNYLGKLRTLGVATKGRPITLTPELWEAICA